MEHLSDVELVIGLDLGDRNSHFFLLESVRGDSDEGERGTVDTTPEPLERFFRSVPRSLVVIEAGTHSPWVSRLIVACGHKAMVANARQLALIYKSNNKTDRTDSERLARLGRFEPELLCPIVHRGEEAQRDLAVIRTRDALVRARTLLINNVRGQVKSFGARIPPGISTPAFHHKAKPHLPAELSAALSPVLVTLALISTQIRELDRKIERLCREEYSETKLLRQVKGVGPITALTFVLTIDDPHRFARSRDVGAYLGLVPRRDASGRRDPELRITKAGDRALRRLLVQCAHQIIGRKREDSDLRRWGESLAARGKKNAHKRAVVAVARKLAVLLHRLWVTGSVYEPLRSEAGQGDTAEERGEARKRPAPRFARITALSR